MSISLSKNINAANCAACAVHQPWSSTLARLQAKLNAHNVTWPHFVVMHGKDKSCAHAAAGKHDRGLYVVAINASGVPDKRAIVFARKAPYYVGVSAILNNRAF